MQLAPFRPIDTKAGPKYNFTIEVIKAANLSSKSLINHSPPNAYVEITEWHTYNTQHTTHRTEVVEGSFEPVWNERFSITDQSEDSMIQFEILDRSIMLTRSYGSVKRSVRELLSMSSHGETIQEIHFTGTERDAKNDTNKTYRGSPGSLSDPGPILFVCIHDVVNADPEVQKKEDEKKRREDAKYLNDLYVVSLVSQ
ncbi:hypothetical protein ONZ45_g14069 [Pleurotus djamor]|nr:hypothetical protein ONZ45_g14069 [Pleurotus djamor]